MPARLRLATVTCALLLGAADPGARADDDPRLALMRSRWPGTVITYGFPEAGFRWKRAATPAASWAAGFLPANGQEKMLYRRALGEWAAASGGAVRFVETAPEKAQLRLAVTTASMGTLPNGTPYRGWTFLPGSGARAGETWLQVGLRALGYADGQRGGWVIRHEVGHALGLKHPHEGSPRLPVALDCAPHTVMTYRTYCGDPRPDGWPDGLPSYPHALGNLDGAAVRLLYAAPAASVAAWSAAGRGMSNGEE